MAGRDPDPTRRHRRDDPIGPLPATSHRHPRASRVCIRWCSRPRKRPASRHNGSATMSVRTRVRAISRRVARWAIARRRRWPRTGSGRGDPRPGPKRRNGAALIRSVPPHFSLPLPQPRSAALGPFDSCHVVMVNGSLRTHYTEKRTRVPDECTYDTCILQGLGERNLRIDPKGLRWTASRCRHRRTPCQASRLRHRRRPASRSGADRAGSCWRAALPGR